LSEKVVIVGQGYVGLPLALRAVESGFEVTGLDRSQDVVNGLNNGMSHIDDITDDELRTGLAAGYMATLDAGVISDADVVVVCVPTPLSPEGGPDLTAVRQSAAMIGERLTPGTLVVLESTTHPGTTEEIFAPLVNPRGYTVGEDIFIAFSPERIDPGNPTFGIGNTPKVVGGMTAECSRRAVGFYGRVVDTVVEARGPKEAEMAKLLENTFRHVNIALVNEMVRFCDELDIDLWNAIDCAATKPFGYMAFRPGPGVGGHCIPVDPSYLSHRVKASLGYAFRMVELAEEINEAVPGYVASRLWRLLNKRRIAMNGARVLLVGVSYKPDISDSRETPAEPLARRLAALGAVVSYHDPLVENWCPSGLDGAQLLRIDDVYEAAAEADAVVLLQPHSGYDLQRLSEASRLILDTRGKLDEGPGIERL
jgi:UDP-N-acetyl-D-glucosamine dehydrogenase